MPTELVREGEFGVPGTEVWLSFLAQKEWTQPETILTQRRLLFSLDSGEIPLLRVNSQGIGARSQWTLEAMTSSGAFTGIHYTSKPSTTLSLIVIQMEFTSGIDFSSIWINPDLSAGTLGERDGFVNGNLTFDAVALSGSGPADGAVGSFDEIRIGSDFASVIPEPSMAMIVFSALALNVRRRRRMTRRL